MVHEQGVANGVVEESITEADLLLTNVQAGTMLTDVALFVDSDSQALGHQATIKYWRQGWGGGWCVTMPSSQCSISESQFSPHYALRSPYELIP